MNDLVLFFSFPDFDPPIGMNSKKIVDGEISATSKESSNYQSSYGRLHLNIGGGGWCAYRQNTEQYLQVIFKRNLYVIYAVATQGVINKKSWVKTYYISYARRERYSTQHFYHVHNYTKVIDFHSAMYINMHLRAVFK